MNKRLPLLLSLLGVILLAASLAYWILQLYQPPQRPLAAAPASAMAEPSIDAAATLFGGQVAVASATNYQLTGIVSAGRDSVAILVADNAPPKALKLGKEISPGVTLAEVYPRYVMLADGGVMKRVDLAADAKGGAALGAPGNLHGNAPVNTPPAMAPGAAVAPRAATQPTTPAGTPAPQAAPSGNFVPEPPMSPGAVSQQPPQQVPEFVPPGEVGPREAPQQATTNERNQMQMPAPAQQNSNAPVR
jgi:general secretion pathway protein C